MNLHINGVYNRMQLKIAFANTLSYIRHFFNFFINTLNLIRFYAAHYTNAVREFKQSNVSFFL